MEIKLKIKIIKFRQNYFIIKSIFYSIQINIYQINIHLIYRLNIEIY